MNLITGILSLILIVGLGLLSDADADYRAQRSIDRIAAPPPTGVKKNAKE